MSHYNKTHNIYDIRYSTYCSYEVEFVCWLYTVLHKRITTLRQVGLDYAVTVTRER